MTLKATPSADPGLSERATKKWRGDSARSTRRFEQNLTRVTLAAAESLAQKLTRKVLTVKIQSGAK